MKILLAVVVVSLCTFSSPQAPQGAEPLEQHAWLERLVGEWTASGEAPAEGGLASAWRSTERVRSVGGLWIVDEGTMESGGQTVTSLMTLGYDPRKSAFIGTWIDTTSTMMWNYVGQLDAEGRVLTLETEGPSFEDPEKTARFRDQIELIGDDTKRTTSSMLGEDGTWTVYMTADSKRVK